MATFVLFVNFGSLWATFVHFGQLLSILGNFCSLWVTFVPFGQLLFSMGRFFTFYDKCSNQELNEYWTDSVHMSDS